ncbi:AraC-type DNA-binding protein [Pseudarcicella hirudinis]|uniref:AraC-type DNA-binding protein n=2 Tax=Pseudarcicella hirudinis TaxID=1079859 RepID=A0A1I5YN29_9BACT|nr:AraC family transcriptional regulator [Pseudarcicella hirudinis]SFQ45530.1 AraC-type DNA-binding protein [Pseudarcicella hirudinis]
MILLLNTYIILQCGLYFYFFCIRGKNNFNYFLCAFLLINIIQRLYSIAFNYDRQIIKVSWILQIIPHLTSLIMPYIVFNFISLIYERKLSSKKYLMLIPPLLFLFVRTLFELNDNLSNLLPERAVFAIKSHSFPIFKTISYIYMITVAIKNKNRPTVFSATTPISLIHTCIISFLIYLLALTLFSPAEMYSSYLFSEKYVTQIRTFHIYFAPLCLTGILLFSSFLILQEMYSMAEMTQKTMPEKEISEDENYSKRGKCPINEESRSEYLTKLKDSMLIEKQFLDMNITLSSLASKLEISTHQLSYLINSEFDKNFNQFINQYRIEAAKKILENPDNNELTMLAVAIDSGFKTESVFYSAFKKETGFTPNQYKQHLNNQRS